MPAGTHMTRWVYIGTRVQSLILMGEYVYISQDSTSSHFIKYKTNSLVMISLNADVFFLLFLFKKVALVNSAIVEVA